MAGSTLFAISCPDLCLASDSYWSGSAHPLNYESAVTGLLPPPMLRLVTRFLLLLLIAALPLQGVTAATMMAKGVTQAYAAVVQVQSDGQEGVNSVSSDEDDDHCIAYMSDADTKQQGKSGKHAGHACPGCAACSLCSVVPYATPLFVHLDNAPAQAPSGLTEAFVSHISDALQRPPASVV